MHRTYCRGLKRRMIRLDSAEAFFQMVEVRRIVALFAAGHRFGDDPAYRW